MVGGTEEVRDQAMEALNQDLGTERGAEMVKQFLGRVDANGYVEPVTAYLDSKGDLGTFSARNGNQMVLSTQDLNSTYAGRLGAGSFDYDRIFAHELGHMAFGVRGIGTLNIDANENVIMNQLGYPNDRLYYHP